MDICCSQALNVGLLRGKSQREWLFVCVCLCLHPHMYVRVCISHQTYPLGASDGPEVPRISHAHSHQAVSSTTLSHSSLSLSHFHPVMSSSPSPFHSLAPVITAAIIIPLCFQLIFSLTSSVEENNYQMGTPCFNRDFAGLFCSRLWNLPMFLPPPPHSLTPVHTSVHSEIALGASL